MAENTTPAVPQEEEVPVDLITLEDENGAEHTFEVLDDIEYNGAHYLALVPYVETEEDLLEEDLDLILMKEGEDSEGTFLDIIEDDKERDEVAQVFQQRLSELYDIET